MNIQNENGLLIDTNSNRCIGYLIDFSGRGIYSPIGKVEITEETAKRHNELLSEAELAGLDNNCQIGQCGTFYFIGKQVTTFMGLIVSTNIRLVGNTITFTRNGKTFRGKLQKDADCFNFRRIK